MSESNHYLATTDDAGGLLAPSWLLRHRVTVPQLTHRYCERVKLRGRCDLTRPRVTLMMAPAGFGKTTLLAACCRDAVGRGVPTAWLTLDREDGPIALSAYLMFAFHEAGLDVLAPFEAEGADTRPLSPQATLLVRSLEEWGEPCVLALDELERLADPDSVSVLSYLLKNAPPCLHVAVACRELPVGLNALDAILGGDAQILTADNLRFSEGDIARFFDFKLTRSELAAVVQNSAGWPIALQICRNVADRHDRHEPQVVRESLVFKDVIDNWIEGRFWEGVPDGDRDLILDVGLFDWIDEDLLDEVLQSPQALARVVRMPRLAGLLDQTGGAPDVYRLHPLLREHCTRCCRRTTPERYRDVHRRIGKALARRGEIVAAMRHAADAGDPDLAGTMLLEAGCLQWWLRNGVGRLAAACRYLTDDTIAAHPRLMLARCVVLMATGRLSEARQQFAEVPWGSGHPRTLDFELDWQIARGVLAVTGCEPVDSPNTAAVLATARRCADMPSLPLMLRAAANWGLCLFHNLQAEFDSALHHGRRVRKVGQRSAYLNVLVDFELGQIAMARGHIQNAAKWYRNGQQAAKAGLLHDPSLTSQGDVLQRELNLERNRVHKLSDHGTRLWKDVYEHGAPFALYAAASDVTAELELELHGVGHAIATLDEMWEHARCMGLTALGRFLAAKYVSVLADSGRTGQAERLWRTTGMPTDEAGCLDLARQTWREMEAVSCARLRMLTELGKYEAGRMLVRDLVNVASERGLKRTWLRALALSTALELRAGDDIAAAVALEAYLKLHAGSGYDRPLVRVGGAVTGLLGRCVESMPDGTLSRAAQQMWSAARRGDGDAMPQLTRKQKAVLARLSSQHDRDIANALGLTVHGVRYHVGNIFHELRVSNRAEAVRRAHSLGLLPD